LEGVSLKAINTEIVFLCQETGFAMERVGELLPGCRVIDLSADYRLKDPLVYEEFYNRPHLDPHRSAVYGLPELVDRKSIANATLVANPGCYPTASLLALMPLAKAGLISKTPIVDAKSGVSGAGRSRTETDYLFTEIDHGFKAYGVNKHRHTPEIEQMLGQLVRFTPHLVPMPRGIHATAYVEMEKGVDLPELYERFYEQERFVRVQNTPPSTKQTLGSNSCVIAPFYDPRTGHAVICSVIDNLVKGAAGQAIQNMNIMLGFAEDAGLPQSGIWP
jgi:N-acetyl-gamma-glutamyl-phosphate reductase